MKTKEEIKTIVEILCNVKTKPETPDFEHYPPMGVSGAIPCGYDLSKREELLSIFPYVKCKDILKMKTDQDLIKILNEIRRYRYKTEYIDELTKDLTLDEKQRLDKLIDLRLAEVCNKNILNYGFCKIIKWFRGVK